MADDHIWRKLVNPEKQILRVGIDGRWTPGDFVQSFWALENLYNSQLVLALENEDFREYQERYNLPPIHYRRGYLAPRSMIFQPKYEIARLVQPSEKLVVQSIQYGSPGFKDLAGLGEIVGHVTHLVEKLIDKHGSKRQTELENDRREIENEQLKLVNELELDQRQLENERRFLENRKLQIEAAQELADLADKMGLTEVEKRQFVFSSLEEQQPLIALIEAGKIVSAKIIPASDSRDEA